MAENESTSTRLSFRNRFAMNLFVAIFAKRQTVFDDVSKRLEIGKRFQVMGVEVSASVVAAMLASVIVSFKYCRSPRLIFRLASIIERSLKTSVRKIVGVLSSRRSFFGYRGNLRPSFGAMLCAGSIASTPFRRLAHFAPRFVAHSFAFHWRNER